MPYEFTPDSYSQFSEAIVKAQGDQATISTVLADMQGTFVEAVAAAQASAVDMEKIKAENTRLIEANSKLLLRVGQQINQENGFQVLTQQPKQKSTAQYMQDYFDKLDGRKR